jgi:hypothetical protein
MYPNQTCSYRLVASSIVKEIFENEVKMFRFIKLRVSVNGGRVKVQGYKIEDPRKVEDNFGIFESFKQNKVEDLLNTTFTVMNVTSQLYISVIPESFGSILTFEY